MKICSIRNGKANSSHQEFQVQPDYVVSPRLGPKRNAYLQEFRTIMGNK